MTSFLDIGFTGGVRLLRLPAGLPFLRRRIVFIFCARLGLLLPGSTGLLLFALRLLLPRLFTLGRLRSLLPVLLLLLLP